MERIETRDNVQKEAEERLHPSLRNPSYLVLSRRQKIFSAWLQSARLVNPSVLDVGGRIQPYRPLLSGNVKSYIAVDLAHSPFVDVRANAAALPFASDTFDVVFCTQVLEYLPDPSAAAREIHRVLKPDGIALLSFASFYPRAVEEEHWRFLPSGMRFVLMPFRRIEIVPEGSSISGFFRASCVCFSMFARVNWLRTVVTSTIVPVLNLSADLLERVSDTQNDQATANYSVLAQK
jgi:SAM-dependent methyltransferase